MPRSLAELGSFWFLIFGFRILRGGGCWVNVREGVLMVVTTIMYVPSSNFLLALAFDCGVLAELLFSGSRRAELWMSRE